MRLTQALHRLLRVRAGPERIQHRVPVGGVPGRPDLTGWHQLSVIAHYIDNRRGRDVDGTRVDPIGGAVERWVAYVIAWADDPKLVSELVEQKALWRRAKQVTLVATPG